MGYNIEWRDAAVIIEYDGDLNINDLFKAGSIITSDLRYDLLKSVTTDFLKVKSLEITELDIKNISTRDAIPSIWNPNLKFSIVSNNSDIKEMVLYYIDLMKINEWEIKLFNNLEESAEWCNN